MVNSAIADVTSSVPVFAFDSRLKSWYFSKKSAVSLEMRRTYDSSADWLRPNFTNFMRHIHISIRRFCDVFRSI